MKTTTTDTAITDTAITETPADRKRVGLVASLQRAIVRCDVERDKFVVDLQLDAKRALEWSDKIFSAIAQRHVAACALARLETGVSVDDIIDELREDALRAVRCPPRSTSPATNLMSQEMGVAYATLLETITSW